MESIEKIQESEITIEKTENYLLDPPKEKSPSKPK